MSNVYVCMLSTFPQTRLVFMTINSIKIDPGDPWKSLDRVQSSKGEGSWEASPLSAVL